jgi:nitric-oxide synthase
MLVHQKGHLYVCGDCTMAEGVYQSLKQIIKIHGSMVDEEIETYMLSLRVRLYLNIKIPLSIRFIYI